jgi:hypothetical protein
MCSKSIITEWFDGVYQLMMCFSKSDFLKLENILRYVLRAWVLDHAI